MKDEIQSQGIQDDLIIVVEVAMMRWMGMDSTGRVDWIASLGKRYHAWYLQVPLQGVFEVQFNINRLCCWIVPTAMIPSYNHIILYESTENEVYHDWLLPEDHRKICPPTD